MGGRIPQAFLQMHRSGSWRAWRCVCCGGVRGGLGAVNSMTPRGPLPAPCSAVWSWPFAARRSFFFFFLSFFSFSFTLFLPAPSSHSPGMCVCASARVLAVTRRRLHFYLCPFSPVRVKLWASAFGGEIKSIAAKYSGSQLLQKVRFPWWRRKHRKWRRQVEFCKQT